MKLLAAACVSVLVLLVTGIGCAQAVHVDRSRSQGWLGVEIRDVSRDLKEDENLTVDNGAYVDRVVDDSPADKAGIKEGDVIVKIGDAAIDDASDCTRAVRKLKPHTDVRIEVARKGERKTITATIGRNSSSMAYSYSIPSITSMPRVPSAPRAFSFSFGNSVDGLEGEELTRQLGEFFNVPDGHGILVKNVERHSDASKAGFRAGDIIVKVDKHSVRSMGEMSEEIRDASKDSVAVEVLRKGATVTLWLPVDHDSRGDDDSDLMITPSLHRLQFDLNRMNREQMGRVRLDLRSLKDKLSLEMRNLRESLRNISSQL
jgi:S1-C subfamily serine protease